MGSIAHLEVDDTADDRDSALGDDQYTITTSIASSVQDFKHENGRRYHAFEDDAYFLPNDEVEAARLDLQHHTWKVTMDGGFGRVPITDKIKTVLDVGTGTGIWAIEFAEAHPNIQVIGTDLSPIQPDFVPPNCQFIVDNAEHDWAFDRKFDYIHSRMLTLGLHDWPRFFRQCWEHLEPGGWLETNETQFPGKRAEGDEAKETPFLRWGEHVYEAAGKAGINARASVDFNEQLAAQGFVNIEKADIQWPIGPWPKGKKNKFMGRLLHENTLQAIPAIATALFTRQLGWTKQQVDEDVAECVKDVKSGHFYYPMCLHRAQKPEAAT